MNDVMLLGTCHEETPHYTQKSLVEIIGKHKPDIIFFELPEDWVVDEELFGGKVSGIEGNSIKEYTEKYPDCRIVLYDIKNRNKIYREMKADENERAFNDALELLYKNERLSLEDTLLYEKLNEVFTIRDNYLCNEYPRVINSEISDRLIEYKEKLIYEYYKKVVVSYQELIQYKDFIEFQEEFWNTRNEAMAWNIVKTLMEEKDGIKAIIICGFEHRSILKKIFKKYAEEVTIKEYWDYDINQ